MRSEADLPFETELQVVRRVSHCSAAHDSVLGKLNFIIYTEIYDDNTLLSEDQPMTSFATSMSSKRHCVYAAHTWCSSKHLQLNPIKSEITWIGSRANLRHLHTSVSQSTRWRCRDNAYQCHAWSLCRSARQLTGNVAPPSPNCVIIISNVWRRFGINWATLSCVNWC